MQKKKVIATDAGFKNRQMYAKGDIFEANKDDYASWYKDLEVEVKKAPRRKKSVSE